MAESKSVRQTKNTRRSGPPADAQARFHEEWLGLAQPIEGLVFSVPVLADAQIMPRPRADLTERFRAASSVSEPRNDDIAGTERPPSATGTRYTTGDVVVDDLHRLFETLLGYAAPNMIVDRDALTDDVAFHAVEGDQLLRPSFALARGPFESAEASATDDVFAGLGLDMETDDDDTSTTEVSDLESESVSSASPYFALVWDMRDDIDSKVDIDNHAVEDREQDHDDGDDEENLTDTAPPRPTLLSLDDPEERTGRWRYPPTAKFERLLRHTGIPIGLVSNGAHLRLVYAPNGESTSHLTFRFEDLADPAGRPLLAAFELLLGSGRAYSAAPAHTLEGLLHESRRRQADVTKDLAAQVFEAVEILLAGFERASTREASGGIAPWLDQALDEPDEYVYQGVLTVVLRLVFLLYAEDQDMMPTGDAFYARHLGLKGLHTDLTEDAGRHPESMHHRFGAYGRLLSLFRSVYHGISHRDFHLPPRHGRLFDPNAYPFLEGGLPGNTSALTVAAARADVQVPPVDDGVVHAVLDRLVIFQGQRLSYRTLDVEQLGSIYESLMGYRVKLTVAPAVRLGKHRLWVETADLREMRARDRKSHLKDDCGLTPTQIKKVEQALTETTDVSDTETTNGIEDRLAEALLELAPGRKADRARHRVGADRLVLQPGGERRRSGSHYTPRSLTERIVRRTLEPLLASLGETPTEEQIMSLKICDPAMGSGAFLVETCRQLASELVDVWTREGRLPSITETHGDAHLHARRLVAQRCLYGVDKNRAAVELAKLSLWLVTLDAELPFTFVDHALRHGDSLVGLDLDQIVGFHWKPKGQKEFFGELIEDSLEQALQHRRELHAMAEDEDPTAQDDKRKLLNQAQLATEKVRIIADLCVGAFFAEHKKKRREEEVKRRHALVVQWLEEEDDGRMSDVEGEIRGWANLIRAQHAPFHWWLEFPEVFYEERPDPLAGGVKDGAASMEAFVGNPPFLGQPQMASQLGMGYRDWLFKAWPEAVGKTDLSPFFFRRAADLLGDRGTVGMIATNTISQGDTRRSGLKALLSDGWIIYDAINSIPWTGSASVDISVVHLKNGIKRDKTTKKINGTESIIINSRLRQKPERPDAIALKIMEPWISLGCKVGGKGFVLSPEEVDRLIKNDTKNKEAIQPFIGSKEVNTSPTQEPHRFVIDFKNISIREIEKKMARAPQNNQD